MGRLRLDGPLSPASGSGRSLPHFDGGRRHGDDRGHPRHDEKGQGCRAERDEAGRGSHAREVRCLGEEGADDGADQGGGRFAGEEYGTDPARPWNPADAAVDVRARLNGSALTWSVRLIAAGAVVVAT